jgi:hypothetical protein
VQRRSLTLLLLTLAISAAAPIFPQARKEKHDAPLRVLAPRTVVPFTQTSVPRFCSDSVQEVIQSGRFECSELVGEAAKPALRGESVRPVRLPSMRSALDIKSEPGEPLRFQPPKEPDRSPQTLYAIVSLGLSCPDHSRFQTSLNELVLEMQFGVKRDLKPLDTQSDEQAKAVVGLFLKQHTRLLQLTAHPELRKSVAEDIKAFRDEIGWRSGLCPKPKSVQTDLSLASRAIELHKKLEGKQIRSTADLWKAVEENDRPFLELLYGEKGKGAGALLDLWIGTERADYLRDLVVNGPLKTGSLTFASTGTDSPLFSKMVGRGITNDVVHALDKLTSRDPKQSGEGAAYLQKLINTKPSEHPKYRSYFQDLLGRLDASGLKSDSVDDKLRASRLRAALQTIMAQIDTKVPEDNPAWLMAMLPERARLLAKESATGLKRKALSLDSVAVDESVLNSIEAAGSIAEAKKEDTSYLLATNGLTPQAYTDLQKRIQAAKDHFEKSVDATYLGTHPHFYGRDLKKERVSLRPDAFFPNDVDRLAESLNRLGVGMSSDERLKLRDSLPVLSLELLANMAKYGQVDPFKAPPESEDKLTGRESSAPTLPMIGQIAFSPQGRTEEIEKLALSSWMGTGHSANHLLGALNYFFPNDLRIDKIPEDPAERSRLANRIEAALAAQSNHSEDTKRALVMASSLLRETGHKSIALKPRVVQGTGGKYEEKLDADVLETRLLILKSERDGLAKLGKHGKFVLDRVESIRNDLAKKGFGLPLHSELALIRFLRDGGEAAKDGLDVIQSSLKPKDFGDLIAASDPEGVADLFSSALRDHAPDLHYAVTHPSLPSSRAHSQAISEIVSTKDLSDETLSQVFPHLMSQYPYCYGEESGPIEVQAECVRSSLKREAAVHLIEVGRNSQAREVIQRVTNDRGQTTAHMKVLASEAERNKKARVIKGAEGKPFTLISFANLLTDLSDETTGAEIVRRKLLSEWGAVQRSRERKRNERFESISKKVNDANIRIREAEEKLKQLEEGRKKRYWNLAPEDYAKLTELQDRLGRVPKPKAGRAEWNRNQALSAERKKIEAELAPLWQKAGHSGEALHADQLEKIHTAQRDLELARSKAQAMNNTSRERALLLLSAWDVKNSSFYDPKLPPEQNTVSEIVVRVQSKLAECVRIASYEENLSADDANARAAQDQYLADLKTFCTPERVQLWDSFRGIVDSLSQTGKMATGDKHVDYDELRRMTEAFHKIAFPDQGQLKVSQRVKNLVELCRKKDPRVDASHCPYLEERWALHQKAKPDAADNLDRTADATEESIAATEDELLNESTFQVFDNLVSAARQQEYAARELDLALKIADSGLRSSVAQQKGASFASQAERELKDHIKAGNNLSAQEKAEWKKQRIEYLLQTEVGERYETVLRPVKEQLEWGKAFAESLASHRNAPDAETMRDPSRLADWIKQNGMERITQDWILQVTTGMGGRFASEGDKTSAEEIKRRREAEAWKLLSVWASNRRKTFVVEDARKREIEGALKDIVAPTGVKFAESEMWDWDKSVLWKLAPGDVEKEPPGPPYVMTQKRFRELLNEYHALSTGKHGLNQGQLVNGMGEDEFDKAIHAKFMDVGATGEFGYQSMATAVNPNSFVKLANKQADSGAAVKEVYEFSDFKTERPNLEAIAKRLTAMTANNGPLARAIEKQAGWGEGVSRVHNSRLGKILDFLFPEAVGTFKESRARDQGETENDDWIEAMDTELAKGIMQLRGAGMAQITVPNEEKPWEPTVMQAEKFGQWLMRKRSGLVAQSSSNHTNIILPGYDAAEEAIKATAVLVAAPLTSGFVFGGLALSVRGAEAARFARTASNLKRTYSTLNSIRRAKTKVWWLNKGIQLGQSSYQMSKMGVKSAATLIPITGGFGLYNQFKNQQADVANDIQSYPSLDMSPKNGIPDWKDAITAGVSYSFPEDLKEQLDSNGNGIPDYDELFEHGYAAALLPSQFTTGSLLDGYNSMKGSISTMALSPFAAAAVGRFGLSPIANLIGKAKGSTAKVEVASHALPKAPSLLSHLNPFKFSPETLVKSFKMMSGMGLTKIGAKMTAGEKGVLENIAGNLDQGRWKNYAWESSAESLFMAPFDDLWILSAMKKNPGLSQWGIQLRKSIVNHGQDGLQGAWEVYKKGGYTTATGSELKDYWEAIFRSIAEGSYMSRKASNPKNAMLDALPDLVTDEILAISRSGGIVDDPRLAAMLPNGKTIGDVIIQEAKLVDFSGEKSASARMAILTERLFKKGVEPEHINVFFESALRRVSKMEASFGELDTFTYNIVREKYYRGLVDGTTSADKLMGLKNEWGRPGKYHYKLELAEVVTPEAGRFRNGEVERVVDAVAKDYGLEPAAFRQYVLDAYKSDPEANRFANLRTLASRKLSEETQKTGRKWWASTR